MVAVLRRRGFLLTDLLPGCGTDDPLWHLLTKIPAANEVRGDLALIRRHLADADTCPPGEPRRLDLRTASATSPPATPALAAVVRSRLKRIQYSARPHRRVPYPDRTHHRARTAVAT